MGAARRRAGQIVAALKRRYPDARVPLHHENAFQLLVATILSAQCTDAMVNRVTPVLFARYRTARDFAAARPRDLEALIRPTGFFRQKTKAIIGASRTLVERFGGEVPRTMEDLLTLDGVGRKTANVILGGFYGTPGVVVDTHVRRLSQRLALTGSDEPERIEQDLMLLIPRRAWSALSLRLIFFGREVCTARSPRCPACPLNRFCPSAKYRGAPPWMARRGRGQTARRPGAGAAAGRARSGRTARTARTPAGPRPKRS
ncbi:MAG: endonuclease III [Armatimonadetes bacterium]|nr:endonuclease III [Armatimonadota bacterium]